ncbi:mercuric reductase [Lysobacter ciconiae]|uniref:Mercuric reductase n=1 Tax=Novilysobacter ciconiae TaxID=2781022 RepID=A0A7S6UDX2_9GAMM|nr:mercuric reductase [Lysobacter ciconiae]QOW18496.1 mercuric reductase [Lysobacter ciconiae]
MNDPDHGNALLPAELDRHEEERLGNVRPPGWCNPRPTGRYDLAILGGGTAGLTAAAEARSRGARVALIESGLLGGTCLNTGCVPSKSLVHSARTVDGWRDAAIHGNGPAAAERVDFASVMERMRATRARISRGDAAARLSAQGTDVFFGQARFTANDTLEVAGTPLQFSKALVATGAQPLIPSIPGLAECGFLTSDTVFELTALPPRILVIGGGPLGCEMAQALCRFGARTTIVQDWPLFLPREERDAAQILSGAFARDGLEVRLNTRVVDIRMDGERRIAELLSDDDRSTLEFDAILTGTGRSPRVEGMDLELAGIHYDGGRGIHVDDFLRTTNPNVFAAGDVCLEHRFNDAARASARLAVCNALDGAVQRLSELVIPWCTYTDPEIAHVGMYVRQARARDIGVRTFTVPMHTVDRAIIDGEDCGFVKIHVRDGTAEILGATIVARHAGEMINEITLAMVAKLGLDTLSRVIHPSPTQSEAIRMAADAFVRSQRGPAVTGKLRD